VTTIREQFDKIKVPTPPGLNDYIDAASQVLLLGDILSFPEALRRTKKGQGRKELEWELEILQGYNNNDGVQQALFSIGNKLQMQLNETFLFQN